MTAPTTRPALTDVTVTRMRPRHLDEVLAIEGMVYPRPWSAGLFEAELDQPDRHYLVATRPAGLLARRVVGYGGILLAVDEAHVTTIAVDPRHHRSKIATRLLLALLRAAIASGATAATLEVRAGNAGARRLYEGFGFVAAGVRPGYYAETGEDAVIMWLHDLQGPDVADRLAAQERRLDLPGGASGAPDHAVPWVRGRVGLPEGR